MHYLRMRTHADIAKAAGREAIASGLDVSVNTVNSWIQRNSIPDQHWKAFADSEWATLEELATHAAQAKAA